MSPPSPRNVHDFHEDKLPSQVKKRKLKMSPLAAPSTALGRKKGKKVSTKKLGNLLATLTMDDQGTELHQMKSGELKKTSDKVNRDKLRKPKKEKKHKKAKNMKSASTGCDNMDVAPASSERSPKAPDQLPGNSATLTMDDQSTELHQMNSGEVERTSDSVNRDTWRNPKKEKKHKKAKLARRQEGRAGHAGASKPPVFVESHHMTQFEGYWVRPRAVLRLERVRAELAATISDPHTLQRQMKKRKRAEHQRLLSWLAKHQLAVVGPDRDRRAGRGRRRSRSITPVGDAEETDATDAAPRRAQDSEVPVGVFADRQAREIAEEAARPPLDGSEQRMVKFDNVWMTADAVGRLKELHRRLKQQRVAEPLLRQTMKTARRREETMRKREAKKVCLGCRQPGHFVSNCPQRSAGRCVTGICFKCGSTEHRLNACRSKTAGTPHAVCFVCTQPGHLSGECPENPRGVYPRGGACKICQQRSHLADQCPERPREEVEGGGSGPRLATRHSGAGVEDDYEHDFRAAPTPAEEAAAAGGAGRQPRQVTF